MKYETIAKCHNSVYNSYLNQKDQEHCLIKCKSAYQSLK